VGARGAPGSAPSRSLGVVEHGTQAGKRSSFPWARSPWDRSSTVTAGNRAGTTRGLECLGPVDRRRPGTVHPGIRVRPGCRRRPAA
jgi:hypothetical protein